MVICVLIRASFSHGRKAAFAVAIAGSIALKLFLAAQGHNYDVDSYGVVATLVQNGKSVYANTGRFNYAPPWAFLVAGLQQASQWLLPRGPETFHIAVAGFLSVNDAALAVLTASAYSYGAGMFFLCSPVVALLTGYHSQFENLALLPGLAAWLLIRRGPVPPARSVVSALLLGLSLTVKHVLFLFPAWVLFWPRLGTVRKRLIYVAFAYSVFGLSFLPWWADPASRAGILRNVFSYRSYSRLSLLQLITAEHSFSEGPSAFSSILTPLWIVTLVAIGLALRRRDEELFPMYLLAMFALSPALMDQYLAVPMLACAIFWRNWAAWAFAGAATAALLGSPCNVLRSYEVVAYFTLMPTTQICAATLFLTRWRKGGEDATAARAIPLAVARAATLVFAGAAIVWLRTLASP